MDTNILLGAKGIEIPNPLQAAGQGLTLANLYNSNQLGQMNLEMQRQRAAFYGGPDAAALWNGGGAAGGAVGAPDMSAIGKYGLAAPGLVEDFLKMQKQTSDIAESQAKSEQSRTEALTKKLTTLGNYSAKAMQDPTPQNIQGYLRQHQLTGAPSDFFGPMPPLGSSQDAWQKYLAGVTAVTQDEATRQTAAKQLVMLPLEAAASKAATAQIQQNMGFKPQEVANSTTSAAASMMGAQTGRANLLQPEMKESPFGTVYQTNRFGTPGQPGFGSVGTPPTVTSPPGANVPSGGAIDTTGKLIAEAKMPLPARVSALGMAATQSAAQQNPNIDATTFSNKSSMVDASGAGPIGGTITNLNTAVSHLDTMGKLFNAMSNGSIPLVNRYANVIAAQTGSPAPTNFNAAKQVVANEVVKAMIAAGSAEGDRDKAYGAILDYNSPQQLEGAIKTYQSLFVGKLGAVKQQYEVNTKLQNFNEKLSPDVINIMNGAGQNSVSVPGGPNSGWKIERVLK